MPEKKKKKPLVVWVDDAPVFQGLVRDWSDRLFSSIPILFLTSCSEDIDYIKHLDIGGTAYLNKPVDKTELLKTLNELLTSRPKPETLRWGV